MTVWFGYIAAKALETGRGKGDEQTVLKLLQFIGAVSGGRSVTQVALGYLMAKGGFALIGCLTQKHRNVVPRDAMHLGSMLAGLEHSQC